MTEPYVLSYRTSYVSGSVDEGGGNPFVGTVRTVLPAGEPRHFPQGSLVRFVAYSPRSNLATTSKEGRLAVNTATSVVEPTDASRGCHAVCRMASVALLLIGVSACPAHAGQAASHEVVGLVLDAIEQNFSLIKTASLTVREVVEDSTVDRLEGRIGSERH